ATSRWLRYAPRESACALSRPPPLSASSDRPRTTRDWSISCWARSVVTVAPSAGGGPAGSAPMVRRAVRARRIERRREVRLPSLGSPNRADDTEIRPRLSALTARGPPENRAGAGLVTVAPGQFLDWPVGRARDCYVPASPTPKEADAMATR